MAAKENSKACYTFKKKIGQIERPLMAECLLFIFAVMVYQIGSMTLNSHQT